MPDRLAPAQATTAKTRERRRALRRWWLAAIAVGVVVALIAALAIAGFLAPVGSWIGAFRGWIEGFGAWGVAVFELTYILATIAMLPCAPLGCGIRKPRPSEDSSRTACSPTASRSRRFH